MRQFRFRKQALFYLALAMLTCVLFALNKLAFSQLSRNSSPDFKRGRLLQIFYTVPSWISNHSSFVRKRSTGTVYPLDFGLWYSTPEVDICAQGTHISLLFMVHTAPGNFQERINIRRTFANHTFFPGHEIRTVFLVGTMDNNQTQSKLDVEQRTYGDIVQGYFHDSYNNLTLKAVTGLKWIAERCLNVSLVAKIDDDTFVQTFKILEEFLPQHESKHISCNVWQKNMPILREGKWKVETNQLKQYRMFPYTYCSGFAVIMTGDLIPLMYKASLSSPFLWVDDVYFSGILTSKIENVQYRNVQLGKQSSISEPDISNCFKRPDCPYIFTGSRASNMDTLWRMVLQNRMNRSQAFTREPRFIK